MEKQKNDMLEHVDTQQTGGEESAFSVGTIIRMFVLNWQWFLLSTFVCLCLAFVYLRYKSPVFQTTARVLIKDENNKNSRGGSQMLANMQDLGFMSSSNGFDNEVEILHSVVLAREAVKDLKLYVTYSKEGTIKDHLIYKGQPFNIDVDPATLAAMDNTYQGNRVGKIDLKVTKVNDSYNVKGIVYVVVPGDIKEEPFEANFNSYPATIQASGATITITDNNGIKFPENGYIKAVISAPTSTAKGYAARTTVSPTSKTTTIAAVTVKDFNRHRGEDYLKQLITCYNRQANADKNEIAIKTEEFINQRLEKINSELGMTEGELEDYKRRHNLTNLKLDATEALTQISQYEARLADAEMQLQLLKYLSEYVEQQENKYAIIPSNVGLQDAASTALITRYNTAVLNRNQLLQSASERAPQVVALTSTLDDLQTSILQALQQAKRTSEITRDNINKQYTEYQIRVANKPEQERILTQIGRQQEVKSGLYLMLLQKREENSISLAATADKGKMIDDPQFGGKVSPKSSIIMLMALILGLGLPIGILYLMQLLRYKIEGHDDVAKLTTNPIVADVPVVNEEAKNAAGIVVQENQNNQIDEIFRSMRTNVQFMLKENQKVIMFTSTTSGEGKTFNAANLATSFAFLKKKVILIGLDIRKPALGRLFGISDKKCGVTPLLSKDVITYDDIMVQARPSGVSDYLDLLLAGPIPPNPTELLARESLGTIVEVLKNHYDYIILDTAPVGLVTDTLQIAHLADVTMYVCRADYTPKSSFEMFNALAEEGKLSNAAIVLNGVDMTKKKYGYYYGYGRYGKYGKYGRYGNGKRYGYGNYGGYYGSYGAYSNSHYGKKDDNTIKK